MFICLFIVYLSDTVLVVCALLYSEYETKILLAKLGIASKRKRDTKRETERDSQTERHTERDTHTYI